MCKSIGQSSFLAVLMIVILMVGVVLSGCAQAPPSNVEVRFYGATTGATAQLYAHTFVKIINDAKHPWLTATPVETMGVTDSMKTVAYDPALRPISVVNAGDPLTRKMGREAKPPFDKPVLGLKDMVYYGHFGMTFITLNPNIKKPADLYGKTVSTSTTGSSTYVWALWLLTDVWGLDLTKMRLVSLTWAASKDALLDGTIDAYFCAITAIGDKWSLHPSMDVPFLTRQVYFMGPTQEDVARGSKTAGIAVPYAKIPAGALGAKQTAAIDVAIMHNEYGAYEELPENVAYEVTKILYENVDKVGKTFEPGKALTDKTYAWFASPSEKDIHPGALKYFQERKVPVSIGGKTPFD